MHDAIEAGSLLSSFGMLYFVPISLFFVPVIYAALNFGFAGSVATSLWATLITLPNWVFWHEGSERWGVIFQMVIVNAVAVFVGQRVDRERRARQRAEAAGTALTTSEAKYRGLFESNPIAALVLDPTGTILEANPAAGRLFDGNYAPLPGMAVTDLVGAKNAAKLLEFRQDDSHHQAILVLETGEGSQVYVEPTLTRITDSQGRTAIQALLQDVTEEWRREAGLRAYAANILHAQEEERKRIAQDLHDESVQALVMLCRQLDTVEGTGDSLPPSVIEGLREARLRAEEVVEELRGFARALRPPILEDLGLVASIRRLLADVTEGTPMEGRVKVMGEEQRLPPDTELGLFRIAQQALRNVERHAQATRVAVTIAFGEHEARLDVIDNGVGFTRSSGPGDFAVSRQLGLLGMQERAKLLDGSLEIQSSPGHGTRVTVSIPIGGALVYHGCHWERCLFHEAFTGEDAPGSMGGGSWR
ncbi:MAG: PAS domain-containing sensor histidine kinase [Dehalococcoidia bacterium]